MDSITAEELFDILHTMGNETEKEWHALENGGHERAKRARGRRHKLLSYLVGDELAQPQLLCELKHSISVRTEYMELAEKFKAKDNEEMVEHIEEYLDELGEEIVKLIQEIRKEPLEIKT